MLPAVLAAVQELPHRCKRARGLTTGIFFVSKLRSNHSDERPAGTDLENRQLASGYVLVLYQRGDQNWSPNYLLLELNVQARLAGEAYAYALGRAGLPPPPESEACLAAYA